MKPFPVFGDFFKPKILAILAQTSAICISKVLEFYNLSFETKFAKFGGKKCLEIFVTSGFR